MALLTIHYPSPEMLCIQNDGGLGSEWRKNREGGILSYFFGGCLFAGGGDGEETCNMIIPFQ